VAKAAPAPRTAPAAKGDGGGAAPAAKSAGVSGLADLIYRCKSKDRAACTTLCNAGSEKSCGALGRMRN